jgi:hypothetical protein
MKKVTIKTAFAYSIVGIVLCLAALAFTPKRGLDSYEIYLNEKLIMKQFVNQALDLRVLQLEKAQVQDALSIRYVHCNIKGPGSSRTLVLKDEQGHVLRLWDFNNSSDANNPMKLSVGELLQFEKDHNDHRISLNYKSKELPGSELLAFLKFE